MLSGLRESRGSIITKVMILAVLYVGVQALYKVIFNDTVYRGEGYTIQKPPGWEIKEVDDATVMFISPEKDILDDTADAIITIYGKKLEGGAIWLDDYFSEVLKSLIVSDIKVVDKGEIKISSLIAKWVLYNNQNPELLVLSFYMIDDFNRLYRIQYITKPDKFVIHRETFEKLKASFENSKFMI